MPQFNNLHREITNSKKSQTHDVITTQYYYRHFEPEHKRVRGIFHLWPWKRNLQLFLFITLETVFFLKGKWDIVCVSWWFSPFLGEWPFVPDFVCSSLVYFWEWSHTTPRISVCERKSIERVDVCFKQTTRRDIKRIFSLWIFEKSSLIFTLY